MITPQYRTVEEWEKVYKEQSRLFNKISNSLKKEIKKNNLLECEIERLRKKIKRLEN